MKMVNQSGLKDTSFAPRVTGVILAGGKSSRMGRDKAQLLYQCCSFLERAKEVMIGACGTFCGDEFETIVSGINGGLADHLSGCGPLGGIHAVLARDASSSLCLFMPIDMPLLEPQDLLALLECAQSSGAAAYEGSPLPCAILRTNTALKYIDELLNSQKSAAVRTLLDLLCCSYLPLSGELAKRLANYNTPAEYQELLSALKAC